MLLARWLEHFPPDLTQLNDCQLVAKIREGDEIALEFLLGKYKRFVKFKAQSYFLIGADQEDLIQEGMIGLYKAIQGFSEEEQVSFKAFAEICITRQMITAIKNATRKKHIPLNSYISLDKPWEESDSEQNLSETVPGSLISDPVELVLLSERFQKLRKGFSKLLTPLEANVLSQYVSGKSYREIASELHRQVKSVDNALQRVKRKVTLCLQKKYG